jgi:hypothetical protein
MDTPIEPQPDASNDDPDVLEVPVRSFPTWWGPIPSASDQLQLDAIDCDLATFAIDMGYPDEWLLDFANENPPRRRYLLCEELSLTCWAGVYVAVDLIADRSVVIKISRRRTEPEGRHIARINHPNVVTVYDVFVHAGYPTMALEWCMQGNFGDYGQSCRDWKRVLARGLEAGRGLAYCHERGLVHGDVKPQNFLITREVGKLADFGISRSETMEGLPWGSRGFAPPERAKGEWMLAGDVFSFARTLQDALESSTRLDEAACRDGNEQPTETTDPTTNPTRRSARLGPPPEAVGTLLASALVEDSERRPTMAALLDGLEHVLEAADERRVEQERVREEQERSLERERWNLEKRRRQVFLQTAIVSMFAIVTIGSAGLAAKCMVAPEVVKREPSIERAIELADAGDPLGAMLEYFQLDQERDTELSPVELNRLAESLLDSTSGLPDGDATAAASLAEMAATQALMVARQQRDAAMIEKAQRLRETAHAIVNHN